jgi:hypothetical protein
MLKIFTKNFTKSVHMRITVFKKQTQGKNKQMFVVNKLVYYIYQVSACFSFILTCFTYR